MSCNGCRVLRKGCSDSCVLRSCLQWIPSAEAQSHATLFLSKFFGRSDLFSLIAAVPDSQRSSLFRSLLFEACGRTVNPVSGAVGLLSTGKWHMCEAAVEMVLSGGFPHPVVGGLSANDALSANSCGMQSPRSFNLDINFPVYDPNLKTKGNWPGRRRGKRSHMMDSWGTRASSLGSDASEVINPGKGPGQGDEAIRDAGHQETKLLNLFS
ncbi:hypothetical protein MLD38_034491 [Melastoma candidum]|uniref:Uncharacterized protein n=1 Tax=Melastoma candidum TaxID=119954 RepID=A0ACB9MA69_9MYRT|nr:hypothetical protein MLD38_034491 [Melastoma candidum]